MQLNKIGRDAILYVESLIESIMGGLEGLINILDSEGGFGTLESQVPSFLLCYFFWLMQKIPWLNLIILNVSASSRASSHSYKQCIETLKPFKVTQIRSWFSSARAGELS